MTQAENRFDFSEYVSPFSWRYASREMRRIWSEENKRLIWRHIWVCLAQTQQEFGLVDAAQLDELKAHAAQVDIRRALEIEEEIHHDLMAELRTFAEQCPRGGGVLHVGATSMDVEDNADALRIRQGLGLILEKLSDLLQTFSRRIDEWAETPVMAFTHLQPAEPTTLGYRFAAYAQDLLESWEQLKSAHANVRGKGFKGAVGTAAAYGELIGVNNLAEFENKLSRLLDLPFYPIATQTYPRRQDYDVLCTLAGMGAALYKFAFDLRLLQSPPIGEVMEPFAEKQVGSSAMPFKRNPIQAEKIDSLARALSVMPQVAWNNAAHSLLERTLDDSANRRSMLPEAFLIADELLITANRLLQKLQVNAAAMTRNFATYAPFACTERIMMAAARAGADRQEMHEHLRKLALAAWTQVQNGGANPLVDALRADAFISRYIPCPELEGLTQVGHYVGNAPQRARQMAQQIQSVLSK